MGVVGYVILTWVSLACGAEVQLRAPVENWSTGDVVEWLNDIGLKSYAKKASEMEVTGSDIVRGSGGVLESLNVSNPVHCAKLKGHVTSLNGMCPCNTVVQRDMYELIGRRTSTMYNTALLMMSSPRTFFFLWLIAESSTWEEVVTPQSGEPWSVGHLPDGYTDRFVGAAIEEDPLRTFALCMLFPYAALMWSACSYFWSNPVLTVLFMACALVFQITEVFNVIQLTFPDNKSWRAIAKALLWNDVTKDGFFNALMTCGITVAVFLTSFIFPYWLQTIGIVAVFLFSIYSAFWAVLTVLVPPE
eukprot:TRINITY_DN36832_c0_g1_i1.p1 TRINITY_DN36832_c0_g1~~TRINITY_DN36832_c0_g1_i1.p1  ORF type:complete len:303 (+),score=48.46 TRINITY_DN36832_c0_g1_i1:32-940(+)